MEQYLNLVQRVLKEGVRKKNRTGVDAFTIAGATFEHDMADGYPLLTTKSVPFRLIASELEFFIKGITDKKWLQDHNNHIWDEWCTSEKVPYNPDEETKKRMLAERDLGPIYGFQWRHFGAEYKGYDADYTGKGIDQLKNLVDILKKDPNDRRMLVSAWNPQDIKKMALPPCHYAFQVTVMDDKLNLFWDQRSVDTMLGLPFNIASYGLLHHLLAKEANLQEGKLTGFLADVHIYENHIAGAREQLSRAPYPLPTLVTEKFSSLFDWEYAHSQVLNYKKYPKIDFPIAV